MLSDGNEPVSVTAEILPLLLQEVTGLQKEVVRSPAGRVPGVRARPRRINTPASGTASSNELAPAAADS